MAVNHLMLSTKIEEDRADDLLSALTTMAYARPELAKPKKKLKKKVRAVEPTITKKHRSRFFFIPTNSIVDEIEAAKPVSEPKVLEAVNAEVEARVVTYTGELPKQLQPRIEAVREYFVNEILPKVLAVGAGTAQALDVVQRTLGTEVNPQQFAQFERMVERARLIKMASFVTEYMDLPATYAPDLVDSVTPKKEVMFMSPLPGDERRPRPSKAPEPQVTHEED